MSKSKTPRHMSKVDHTQSSVHYDLAGPGYTVSESGYSEYYNRLSASANGKLREKIYGLKQAKAHRREIYALDRRENRHRDKLVIIRVKTFSEVVA